MRPATSLLKVRDRFLARVRRLESLAIAGIGLDPSEQERLAGYYSVELSNAWDGFGRCFCVSILLGTRGSTGREAAKKAATCRTEDEALRQIFQSRNPHIPVPRRLTHRDDPDWYDIDVLLKLASALSFTNEAQVRIAAGFPTQPMKSLRAVRNYYAHKGQSTLGKLRLAARPLGFITIARPSAVLFAKGPVTHMYGYSVFARDLRSRAQAMVP